MVPRIEYRAQEMLVGIIIFVSFYLFNGGGGSVSSFGKQMTNTS